MNGNTENSGNDFFYNLLDNPAGLSHSNAFNLQLLINHYPQSGLLRSMLAVKNDEESVNAASAYVNPKLLYKIAHSVKSLPRVTDEQIAFSEQPGFGEIVRNTTGLVELPNLAIDESNYFHVPIDAEAVNFIDEEELNDGVTEDEQPESKTLIEMDAIFVEVQHDEIPPPPPDDETEIHDLVEAEEDEVISVEEQPEAEISEFVEEEVIEDEAAPEEETQTEENDEAVIQQAEEATSEKSDDKEEALADEFETFMSRTDDISALNDIGERPVYPHQEIDDDVFEEIVSIEDIGIEQLAVMDKVANNGQQQETEAETGNNYEVFEPTLPEDEEPEIIDDATPQQAITGKPAGERLARYNDEKMPYSFMWWLDKTRKEHADVYQPFVEGKAKAPAITATEKPNRPADHLQQQYLENILTVTTVVNELSQVPPKVDAPQPVGSKVDKIIERFIQEEPQIKHPAKAKLDNENKAKKSSEDRDELVTETLAKIYTEQMLYHKAISIYKKLMLKFPEKSLYFAGQIEQLEKKIN